MELTGERLLALPRASVWQALNDPEVLKRCVPGCDHFQPDGEHRYRVGLVVAVGPVKARFNGRLLLSDIRPAEGYALAFEGSGGAAGFGKGTARVGLADADVEGAGSGTRLTYTVQAQVGGKLAQVGARLIDGVAKRMADDFFARFAAAVTPAVVTDTATQQAADAAPITPSSPVSALASAPHLQSVPTSMPAAAQPRLDSAAGVPVAHPPDRMASTTIAVLAAAVAATAAAVAVLAAAIALYALR